MALREFKVPDLGEGLTEAEIVNWLVKIGDTVELNQPLVEVETEKAIVEVPSPYAGVVKELRGAVGERVAVGTTFVVFEVEGADSAAEPASTGSRKEVLVGYGPEEGGGKRRKQRKIGRRPDDEPAAEEPEQSNGKTVVRALATPPVRKLARELGVDIDQLSGSGPDGRVTREDVQAVASSPAAAPASASVPPATAAATSTAPAAATAPVVPRRPAADGPVEERIPVRAIRRSIAEKMVRSKQTIPHVAEWLQLDATDLMSLREQLKDVPESGGKLSPLPIIAKALIAAIRTYPLINSSWDEATTEIVIHHRVHLGIAADTDRGLLVPVVKDADRMSIFELSAEIGRLIELARSGKIGPSDLTGSTVTITNIGSFGMESGTPIINHPEAAILAPGAIAKRPWVVGDEVLVRQVMTLALSFDHRIIDGAYAGRFLRHLGDLIERPARLLASL